MQTGNATVETVWRYLKKIKNGCAFWPSNPTSGNISKGTQNTNSKEHKYPYVHCSINYNHKDMETAEVSISEQMNETTMGYVHNGILFGHKKEDSFTLCNCMEGPGERYAK